MRPLTRHCLAAVVTLLVGPASSAEFEAKQLAGTYDLYNLTRTELGGALPKPSNRMVISGGEGYTFQVRSPTDTVEPKNTWRGTGKLQGRMGYYEWRFEDGKTGRPDFVVTADNILIGHVQIADAEKRAGFDWWYLAKRRR